MQKTWGIFPGGQVMLRETFDRSSAHHVTKPVHFVTDTAMKRDDAFFLFRPKLLWMHLSSSRRFDLRAQKMTRARFSNERGQRHIREKRKKPPLIYAQWCLQTSLRAIFRKCRRKSR